MFRDLAKRALIAGGRTRIGSGIVHAAVMPDPATQTFAHVERWPASLRGFEDLDFLFSSNQLNHGIASLAFDEAAYLYRLVRGLGAGTIVEIGRFKGGSTLLIASAMAEDAELYSYDLHVAVSARLDGAQLDRGLMDALRRYGLDGRVHVLVADSKTVEPPPRRCELVFVDGDHSYEGARADWLRWRELVRPGGHVVFHDAVERGGYANTYAGVVRLVAEIARDDETFTRAPGAGSIAHFVRAA